MRHAGLGTFVSVLLLVTACSPSAAPVPSSSPTPVPISPTAPTATVVTMPALTATLVPTTSRPAAVTATDIAQVAATATATTRHSIPPEFPLLTFTKTDADGRSTVTFTSEGTFETTLKNATVVKGTFDVSGDRLTFHDVSGRLSCKPAQGDGTYRWAFDGTIFKLQGIADTCGARGATLSGSVWTIDR